MGMFDIVKCEYELPLPEDLGECEGLNWEEIDFQTKSFSSELTFLDNSIYSISDDGQIYLEKVKIKFTEDESHPFGGKQEAIPDGVEKQEFTGEVDFYHGHMGEEHDYWIEFKAVFWKGDLKELELSEWKKEDNKLRLEAQQKVQNKLDKEFKKRKKWYYKIYYSFFKFIFTLLGRVLELVVRFFSWLERKILG